MQGLIMRLLAFFLFFTSTSFAQLGTVPMNEGSQSPSVSKLLGQTCPKPLDCSPGSQFLSIQSANTCGCCACHGGATGCAGGAKGQVVCADGTYAGDCACQYTLNKTE